MQQSIRLPVSSSAGAKAGDHLRQMFIGLKTEKNLAVLLATMVALIVMLINQSVVATMMMIARILLTLAALYRTYTWL